MALPRRTLKKSKPAEPTGPEYIVISGRWMYGESRHASGSFRVRYIDRRGRVLSCHAHSALSHDIHTAIMSQLEV